MFIATFCIGLLAMMAPSTLAQTQFHLTPGIVSVNSQIPHGTYLNCLNDIRQAIGMPSCFSLVVEQSSVPNNDNVRRQRIRVYYNGIPLRVARIQASIDANGHYIGLITGHYPVSIPSSLNTNRDISIDNLKSAVVQYINNNDNLPSGGFQVDETMLEHFQSEKQIDIDVATGNLEMVYEVRCNIDQDVSPTIGRYVRFPRGIISISYGQVSRMDLDVLRASRSLACPLAKGGNPMYPGNHYGPGDQRICLRARVECNQCSFINQHVQVINAENSFDRSAASGPMTFKCSQGPRDGTGEYSPASDAFYFSGQFYSMLKRWTGLTNINTEPIKLFVHFGISYPNSFYDGNSLTFGDGIDGSTFPLTISDAISHELCHALTDGFNSLQITKESIALNEAIADIVGKGTSVFDTQQNDWKFAVGFIDGMAPLRHFDQPSLDGIAIENMSDFDANLDIYALMGVYTKFFYELVENENLSYRKGLNAVVFANQIYFNEQTSFIDGACGILRAARDLGYNTNKFKRAFNSVGFDLSFCGLDNSAVPCNV